MGQKRSIYLSQPIQAIIGPSRSGELSGRIANIVDRYSVLCKSEQRALKRLFTQTELNVIAAASASVSWTPALRIVGGILANFEDNVLDGALNEGKVNTPQIADKLRSLSVGQQIALVELFEMQRRGQKKGGFDKPNDREGRER